MWDVDARMDTFRADIGDIVRAVVACIGHVGADAITSATVLGTETKLTWAEFHWNNMLILSSNR